MMSAPERAAFTSKFNLPGGKRATFRNTQGQEQMSVCHRGAGADLPAPGKLNISSHYNAAAESGNAVMTAGMVRGWEGAGTGQPPSVCPSVRPSVQEFLSPRRASPGPCADPSGGQAPSSWGGLEVDASAGGRGGTLPSRSHRPGGAT